MLFNSLEFAIFLPVVFFLYWFVTYKRLRLQNLLIVCASYVFYGWWDWRFLSLIIFSTLVDYFVGLNLTKQKKPGHRKFLLWISILVNLGFLGVFKYYNFFLENFISAFTFFGTRLDADPLNIVLPVGISFYTFQTLSYTIDIYKKKLKPTHDYIAFSAFVSFFPQLVAGPIERASNLLPQILHKRKFNYPMAIDGFFQALWGLFKKIVIADNCAEIVDLIFNSSDASGSLLVLGAILFAFQIYGDFSGYSDIAIGVSKLFGIKLMTNFKYPYFSRDMAEFWRRWHISLSTWFRDYLYIPLGGSRGSNLTKIRNTFIIFIVSGFWHGANWTFIFWGTINAIYFLPLLLTNRNRNNLKIVAKNSHLPDIRELLKILLTFSLTVFAWIFFRAENINQAFQIIKKIFSDSFFSLPKLVELENTNMILCLCFIAILIIIEWVSRKKEYVFENIYTKSIGYQSLILIFLVTLMLLFTGEQQDFIYFQF